MEKSQVEESVISALCDVLPVNRDDVTPQSSYESLGMDSLDVVDATMGLEEDLGIEIPDSIIEDFMLEGHTLDNLVDQVHVLVRASIS